MDTIRLRILTRKSTLGFGKYYFYKIQDFFDRNMTNYLRWVYYNSSTISFDDELLNALRINEGIRINKPGVNRELGEKLIHNTMLNVPKGIRGLIIKKRDKSHRKAQLIQTKYYLAETKGRLQSRNQGKN